MMHNYRMLIITLMVLMMTSLGLAGWSQQVAAYSNAELDEILAPIALYPDPLIAQILPAATYPDQLADAENLIQQGGANDIDQQDWDVSVKAVAYYPSVLQMMTDKPDWTTALGQAYVDQPTQVMSSIQRLRNRARSHGYLATNGYQRVYLDSGYIRIVPVQAQYIYVPQYDPQVVYIQNRGSSNLLSFGAGLLIGAWLDRDMDWHNNRVFYHGWSGGGWIGNSRSHVSITNNYYVNNNYRTIAVDRRVTTRDLGDYRTNVRKNAGTFRLPASRPPTRSTAVSRPTRVNTPSVTTTQRTRTPNTRTNVQPTTSGRSTGRTTTPSVTTTPRRTPSTSTYGQPSQGATTGRRSTGRTNTPSVTTTPRTRTPSTPTYGQPSQGTTSGRRPTGRTTTPSVTTTPRTRTPSTPTTVQPNQRTNRGSSTSRTNTPSVTPTPRSSRSNTGSNVKPSNGATKSRGSSGSKPSGSDSKSKDKTDKSKNDSSGR